jgi:hypothetical protein
LAKDKPPIFGMIERGGEVRMVAAALMAASAPWYLPRKTSTVLGFFEFVHNVRRRGRALLESLLETLLQPETCPQNPQ